MINESKSSITLKRKAVMKDANHKSNSASNEDVFKIYTSKEGLEALEELTLVRDRFNNTQPKDKPVKDNKPQEFRAKAL